MPQEDAINEVSTTRTTRPMGRRWGDWTTVAELQAAAGRLPRHEGAHAMALFREGKWREAVAYVQERLSYYERKAA